MGIARLKKVTLGEVTFFFVATFQRGFQHYFQFGSFFGWKHILLASNLSWFVLLYKYIDTHALLNSGIFWLVL